MYVYIADLSVHVPPYLFASSVSGIMKTEF